MKRLINLWVCLSAVWLAASCAKDAEPLTGNIQGIVTESGTTTPLSGVQVRIVGNGLSATTGSDGQFSFHDLDAETYNLQFMKDGYETNTRSVTVLVGETANCDMQLRPEQADAAILIEPSTLDFGSTQSEMAVTITNKLGLHARPAALLTKTANLFECSVTIQKGEKTVDAKSILAVMTLAAKCGDELTISTQGRSDVAALEAVCALFQSKFGEDE